MDQKILKTVLQTLKDYPKTVFVGIFAAAKYELIKQNLIECKPDLSCELTTQGIATLE